MLHSGGEYSRNEHQCIKQGAKSLKLGHEGRWQKTREERMSGRDDEEEVRSPPAVRRIHAGEWPRENNLGSTMGAGRVAA